MSGHLLAAAAVGFFALAQGVAQDDSCDEGTCLSNKASTESGTVFIQSKKAQGARVWLHEAASNGADQKAMKKAASEVPWYLFLELISPANAGHLQLFMAEKESFTPYWQTKFDAQLTSDKTAAAKPGFEKANLVYTNESLAVPGKRFSCGSGKFEDGALNEPLVSGDPEDSSIGNVQKFLWFETMEAPEEIETDMYNNGCTSLIQMKLGSETGCEEVVKLLLDCFFAAPYKLPSELSNDEVVNNKKSDCSCLQPVAGEEPSTVAEEEEPEPDMQPPPI